MGAYVRGYIDRDYIWVLWGYIRVLWGVTVYRGYTGFRV